MEVCLLIACTENIDFMWMQIKRRIKNYNNNDQRNLKFGCWSNHRNVTNLRFGKKKKQANRDTKSITCFSSKICAKHQKTLLKIKETETTEINSRSNVFIGTGAAMSEIESSDESPIFAKRHLRGMEHVTKRLDD